MVDRTPNPLAAPATHRDDGNWIDVRDLAQQKAAPASAE